MKTIIRDEFGKFYKVKKVYAKGYKAFDPGFSCNPEGHHFKQYRENTVFEETGDTLCEEGMMHASDSISDVLWFYNPVLKTGKLTEFAEVEALSPIKKGFNKWGTNKLKVGRKLSIQEVISICAKETEEIFPYKDKFIFTHATSVIGNTKKERIIYSSADIPKILNSGNTSEIYVKGFSAQIVNFSNFTEINSFAEKAIIYSAGEFCTIRVSGEVSTVICKGRSCEVICTGAHCKVKGNLGTSFTLVETGYDNSGFRGIKNAKTAIIDGEILKPDTFYTLRNGKFVEWR